MSNTAKVYYDTSKTSTERVLAHGAHLIPDPKEVLEKVYAGTIWGDPIRVEFMNGDYEKADKVIADAGCGVVYKGVASVEPYHATIWVKEEDGPKARQACADAGITVHEVKAFY